MIIFQIIQKSQHRGAELFAISLSEYLKRLGHSVITIALFESENNFKKNQDLILLHRPYHKRNYDYIGWKKIAKLIFDFKPDIIQCNSGDTLKYMVFSKTIFRWQTPLIERNASLVGSYIANPIKKWAVGKLYQKATFIISVSNKSKENLLSLYPLLKSKIVVVPIAIENNATENVAWYNGHEADYHIIHVGGFTFEKNHKGLITIYKKFLEKFPNSHLHLLGDGPLMGTLQKFVNEIGLSKNITFYGSVENPIPYISKANLLVLPSIIEGLPSVLLEGMMVKTTIVAYDVGGVSEIIENLKTGYLVLKNDEKLFLEAMIRAVELNDNNIMNNAFELVTKNYKMESIAEQFETHYLNIVNANYKIS
jgi:glycosyltransferase involved in cell wall biosynthesis